MTVKELIAALSSLPPDAEVVIYESPCSSPLYEQVVTGASVRDDGKVEIGS